MTNESAADHPTAPDPRALRALAHPLRWQLIDLIGSEMTATATRCAEVLGESVASCSCHLGILGKYGYVELVPGQAGKEKPWRLASQQQNLYPGDLDTEGALAAEAAAGAFLDHELARMKQRLSRIGREPEPWRTASLLIGTTTWMTAEELRDITDQLKQLVTMHGERAADPASRPPGAREVRVFAVASVAPPVTPSKDSARQASGSASPTGGSMPDFNDYVRTLAGAEAKTGSASWPAAAALWARVVELNPVVGRHWVRLAEARYELGDFDGALAAYARAQATGVWSPPPQEIETIFPAEVAYQMATCHVRLGDRKSALRELRRALSLGLRDLGRPTSDEHWEPLLGDEAVREMLGIIDTTGMTRDEGWRADLAFLAREIKRRAYAPFREISEPEFDAAVARLAEDMPGLSDSQVLTAMMRLLRPLGDGHAFVLAAMGDEDARLGLPVKFYRFSEGLFVAAAAEAYRELIGAQVLSVDGHPVDDVLAAVEPLISRDNDQQVMWLGPEVLRWTPVIHSLGLISDPGKATLTVRFPDQTTGRWRSSRSRTRARA